MMEPDILLKSLELFLIGMIFFYIYGNVSILVCVFFLPPGYCVFKAMTYITVKIVNSVYVQAIL